MSESYERLHEQKEAIEARAAERAERDRWIAVTPETMPPVGSPLLVHYFNRRRLSRVVRAVWATAEWIACEWEDSDATPGWYETADETEGVWPLSETVTHWMPLPAPPVLP